MMNLQKMMQQAQKVQAEMKKAQEELEKTTFEGSAGDGAVVVTCNGKYEFQSVKIKPEAAQDPEILEDLVLAALKDTTGKIATTIEQKMSSVTSGLNLPGGLPF